MNSYIKDPVLGQKIGELLTSLKIENPIQGKMNPEQITASLHQLITGLGISTSDESIAKTPERVAQFFINELFYGLDYTNFPKVSFTKNQYGYYEPVFAKNISFRSTCEHHFVTIDGEAFVAYIPRNQIIGLSKINRIIDFFARRPQIQERATLQIFHALQYILNTEDVAILIRATHHCITMRGITDHNVQNLTYQFGGKFAAPEMKREFLEIIKESV